MINDKLFLRIKNLPFLTKGEDNIVRYFKNNRSELAFANIHSISKGANVSNATVTRFIKKLEYKDFAEFKSNLRRELFSNLDSPYRRYQAQKVDKIDKESDSWPLTVEAAIGDLKEALALNSNQKITEAAEIMSETKGRLFIIGQRSSYGIAHYFMQYLNFCKPAILLDNLGGCLIQQLLDINENDTLFAISYFGYTQQTTLTMKHFYEQGAQVLLLTDSETAPPVKWSNLQLIAPTQWETVLMSRCSCMMVVEGILSAMTSMADEHIQKREKQVKVLAKEFQVFTVDKDLLPENMMEQTSEKLKLHNDQSKTDPEQSK